MTARRYTQLEKAYPDSKVHEANMGPTWGRQDPGGPHVGHMNLAIWVDYIYGIWQYHPIDIKQPVS